MRYHPFSAQGNLEMGEEEVVEILLKLQDTQLSAAAAGHGAVASAPLRRGHAHAHHAAAAQLASPPAANGRRYGTRMAAGEG
jgi:hypothetical protein